MFSAAIYLGKAVPQVLRTNILHPIQRHVLPVDEPVSATLVYTDAEGNEKQLKCKLKERC